MGLSNDLISQFVKATKAEKPKKTETTSYGTIVESDGSKWVKLDGSDQLTPINTTAVVADGDRVTVLIKDHSATVTGNLSDPSASSNKVTEMVDEIAKFEIVVADKVSTKELEAQVGRIDTLVSDNVIIKENLTAAEADISELRADNVTISGKLTAAEGEITNLKTDKLDASIADIKYATIENLDATNADIYNLNATYGKFEDLVTNKFEAIDAEIENLDVGSLTVDEADLRYATIAELDAAKANITDLSADVADIDTLIFGSASGDVISSNFANAVIAQLGEAQIKSAMIESIAAGKITAGDIITNNVRVMSEDGSLLISDETIQISDESRVRVQIGKDATGDYSINIWDAEGNLMFSEGGITDDAIKHAIIRDDMVSDNANIAANKLNIDSLFTVINEDGSNTLNSSKILIDADNQTLDVAFKNMTTKVETVEETVNLTQAAVNQNAADMAEIVLKFNTDIENLQTQIDGGITTWFYQVPPSADNEPESTWITDEMKNTHLGDLYYDTEAGTCYRYMLQDGEYFWQQVSDTDVAKALEDAKAAKDLADQKRRVFYEQPKPPYDKGDLWVQGSNGDILRCQTTKTATQSFDQSDWVLASKYTDDTAADAVMAEVVIVKETVSTQGTQLTTIQGQINSKIWEQDITNAVTTLEGEITEITETTNELSTKYSEIDQKVDGISTTVANHTTLITNKADISSVTEVSDKVSKLEQNVEGFKTTVSDTYATKTDLGEINETVTATQQAAQEAKKAAEDADAKAVQAKADLETAEQNLIDVASRVDATEEEIAAAQEAVTKAQNTADTAASNAATAKDAADKAQEAADEAQEIANQAKEDVDGLASRVSTAETNITQNAQKIELSATKSEIAETLEGYYTIEETKAAIKLESDSIKSTVSSTYATKTELETTDGKVDDLDERMTTAESTINQTSEKIELMVTKTDLSDTLDDYYTIEETKAAIKMESDSITSTVSSTYATKEALGETQADIDNLEIGGRNLLANTEVLQIGEGYVTCFGHSDTLTVTDDSIKLTFTGATSDCMNIPLVYDGAVENNEEVTLSFEYRGNITDFGSFYYLQLEEPNVNVDSDFPALEISETEWKEYSYTFSHENSNVRTCHAILMFYGHVEDADKWIEVRNKTLKLEKGNKSTGWSPAPEDVSSDIQNATNIAEGADLLSKKNDERLGQAESVIQQLSDSIVTMVTDENGQSVMQQTSTGWSFNISGMEEMVSDTSANVGSLQDRVDGIDGENGSISVLQNEVNQLKSDTEYVRMGTIESEYGDGKEPCLELGEGDTEFGLKITNTRMIFEDSTGDPTRISKDGLYTNTLTVGNEIRQGSWVWAERANGNYGLMYKGGE